MTFAYYRNLAARQKRIYDRSDALAMLHIPAPELLAPHVAGIAAGLASDHRASTETAARALVDALLQDLRVPPVRLRVLAVRPSSHVEELHGLYEFGGNRSRPVITIWMRTAQRRQVVAFRTFLRTLLHEVAHHLDYEMFELEDSFHTHGFYKRASSLFDQVLHEGRTERRRPPRPAATAADPRRQRVAASTRRVPQPRKRPPPQPLLPF